MLIFHLKSMYRRISCSLWSTRMYKNHIKAEVFAKEFPLLCFVFEVTIPFLEGHSVNVFITSSKS